MKSAIMLAYSFPPEGNAGTYRPLRFVRNLPALGWQVRVISSGTRFERYDPGLLEQVPAEASTLRVGAEDPWQSVQRTLSGFLARPGATTPANRATMKVANPSRTVRSHIRSFVRHAESWAYHPDMQMGWIKPAADATVLSCERSRPDVLWATGPPWSSFLAVERAHKVTGVPYVLDFRTSWTIVPNSFEALRPRWAQRRDRRTLHRLLRGAQAVTFFYEAEAECFWRVYRRSLDSSRIHIIPNGFDGAVEPFREPGGDRFRILYTGTLADYRYDTFLRALVAFKAADPAHAGRLSVEFVGEGLDDLAREAAESGLDDMIATSAPISHAAINERQRSAHALLMFERKPMKGYELLAGAKLFNYLRAGRPIFGVVPRGEAERILRDVGVSTIADPASPERIAGVLKDLLDAWSAGRLMSLVPDRSACERYSAEQQTRALVRALEGVPALEPFVPGSVEVVPSLRSDISAIEAWA